MVTSIVTRLTNRNAQWCSGLPPAIAEAYSGIARKVHEEYPKLRTDLCMMHLHNLVVQFNLCMAYDGDVRDIRRLRESCSPSECQCAAGLWQGIQQKSRWGLKYRAAITTGVSRCLMHVSPPLACAINPASRPLRGMKIHARRSKHTSFLVHHALPLHVRRMPLDSVRYTSNHYFAVEMHRKVLATTSKASLRRIMLLLDQLVFGSDTGPEHYPPIYALQNHPVCTSNLLELLQGVSSECWLQRYRDRPRGRDHLCMINFKRHICWLRGFQEHVVKSGPPYVPRPTGLGPMHDCAFWSSNGEEEEPKRMVDNGRMESLRAQLMSIRDRIVTTTEAHRTKYAFTPDEGIRILDSCLTTEERLIVLMFFVTGVRIEGLAFMQFAHIRCATVEDKLPAQLEWTFIPSKLVTREKGNVTRTLVVSDPCRILLARWFREMRPSYSEYIFPSLKDPKQPISTSYIRRLCGRVFRRSGVIGQHAIPHTFRHTCVHLMVSRGVSMDIIAAWIGHRSASTTAQKYAKLDVIDVQQKVAAKCKFVRASSVPMRDWDLLDIRLQNPWSFEESTTSSATEPATAAVDDIQAKALALLARIHGKKDLTRRTT